MNTMKSVLGTELKTPPQIAAVVVTYYPDLNALERLLESLQKQVKHIVVVDNCSNGSFYSWFGERKYTDIVLIPLGDNYGVAAAQNAGIEWAMRQDMTHVILFDQDSLPEPDMVSRLLYAMQQLTSQGIKAAAVGPRYIDSRNMKHPSFSKISSFKVDKNLCQSSEKIVKSDTIISSGSLIPLNTLAEIGGPLNDLFIDQVDLEWCFRAKSKGYFLFGVCNAILYHSLGETPKFIFGRKFIHQSPLRHYYIFRNAVWLLYKNYVPVGWKVLLIRTLLIRFFVYACLVAPRIAYIKMMIKGILHGLLRRMGRLEINISSI